MKRKIIVILFIGGIIYSCSPTLYMPLATDVSKQEQLLAGRKLYVDRCSGCHNLHFPNEFTAEQWKTNVEEMQVRAKITDNEKQLILQYLTSQP